MKKLFLSCFILMLGIGANAQLTKDQVKAKQENSDVASNQPNTEIAPKQTKHMARVAARKAKQQAKITDVAVGGAVDPEKTKSVNRGRKYYIDVNGTKTYVDSQD